MISAADLNYIIHFWLILFGLGLTFFPLASLVFGSFFDRGYSLAKPLGLLLYGYTVWLLASLKILPFTEVSLLIVLALSLTVNLGLVFFYPGKKGLLLLNFTRKHLVVFFLEELMFFLGLILWSFVRAHEPSIYGLEKFMDFGFINSILRSDYFPPKDIWMTPLSINYYYFGHFTAAFLTKLSGLNSVITYNLMVAAIFALTLTASFSIGANLYFLYAKERLAEGNFILRHRWLILAGLLSAFLVTLGGNLQTIYLFFSTYPNPENPTPFWQLPLGWSPSLYWYPNATRFIPFTIHEFPIYSFVVSDLHGHVFNIPFALLMIATSIKVYLQKYFLRSDYLLIGLLIGVSLMTNVLDGPIYLLFFAVLAVFVHRHKQPLFSSILSSAKTVLILLFLAIFFSLPYWISFKPFAQGIGVLCAPDALIHLGKIGPLIFESEHCARSPLWMLVVLWGFFYLLVIGFIFKVLRNRHKVVTDTDKLVGVMALIATFLILIPEFFYAKDIYPAHYRANTVFKFGYQAFMILGAISGYAFVRVIRQNRSLLYSIALVAFFALVAVYPYFAIKSYYGELKNNIGLSEGLQWLEKRYPDDYGAILWLRENIQGQPVILEAQGDSYTDYARVSANTGLPTVIGWPVHEWLWRGSYDEAGRRSEEVKTLYESPDLTLTKQLFNKFKVQYVFVGSLEREKYTSLNESKFTNLGKVVFQSGETKIYQINP